MNTRSSSRLALLSASLALTLFATACGGGGGGAGGSARALGGFTLAGEVLSLDPGDMTATLEAAGPAGYTSVQAFARDDRRNLMYTIDSDRSALLRIDGAGRVERVATLKRTLGWMAFDPGSGKLVGVAGNAGFLPSDLIRIDPDSGAVEVVAQVSGRIGPIALDPALGRLLAIPFTSSGTALTNTLVAIDLQTGSQQSLFDHVTLHTLNGLTFDPVTRLLHGVDELGGLYAFDLFSQLIESAHFFERPLQDVALDDDTGRFFALSPGGAVMEMILGSTQQAELEVKVTLGRELHGLTFDPAGDRYLAVDALNEELVEVDPRDGRAKAIGLLPKNPFGERRQVHTLAWDPMLAQLYGFDRTRGELITIDPTTAECSEIGLTASADLLLASDPGSGRLFGYDEGAQVLLEIDPSVPSKFILDNAVGLTKVDALTWDPLTQRIVAVHESPGALGVSTISSIPLQGTSGPLPHSRAPEGITAIGRDARTGLFHAFGPRQPWFELELDLSSGSYTRQRITSLDGAWRTAFRAALSVPARGVVYAIDRELLYAFDPSERSMRLLGALADGGNATDLLWDPQAGRLGLRKTDEVLWVSPDIPHHAPVTTSAPGRVDLRLTSDPASGRVFGVEDGILYDVTIGSSPGTTARTQAALQGYDVEALAYSPGGMAVFAMGTRGSSSDPVIVRFDAATGEATEMGPVQAPLLTLFVN